MGYIVDAGSMLTYITALFFTFLGVYVGAALGFIAPKELAPGRIYLLGMQNALLVFMACLLLYAYGAPVWLLALLAVTSSMTLYFTTEATPINQLAFFLMGIAFYFSTKTLDLLIATAILIFLYGLPLGSLYVSRHTKEKRITILTDIFLKYFFFIILGLLTNILMHKLAANSP